MTINFTFDDELAHVLIITVREGWTWADFHASNDAILNYPTNIAIPTGARVDHIVDFRTAFSLPSDGVAVINVKKGEEVAKTSLYDIPRNGGISMYVGNPAFVSALLRTFGLNVTPAIIRQRVMSNIEKAREAIREHRLAQGE
jgi:hypothetical protein